MSPILVRPVREQLEHDRIIRLLQSKLKRRYEAGMNPGAEQTAPVISGTSTLFPDLVLTSLERGRRLQAIVEVETAESVNHLEALAEWVSFAKLRAAFFLYVPSSMVEVARRLCDDNHIVASEIWSYHTVGDEVRFTLVHRAKESAVAANRAPRTPIAKAPAAPAKAVLPKATLPKVALPKVPKVTPAKPAPAKAARAARPVAAPRSKAKPAVRGRAAKPVARAKPAAKKPARVAKRK